MASKPCFDALFYFCEFSFELLELSRSILSVRLLFLYYFNGPFDTYIIYVVLYFIKSIGAKKDSGQPLSLSKRCKNKWYQTWPKPPYHLKSSVHINVPLILKVDQKERYVCILSAKVKTFIAMWESRFILKSYSWQLLFIMTLLINFC